MALDHRRLISGKRKASIASDFAILLRIKQGENENDAIRNRISDIEKRGQFAIKILIV